MKRSFLFSRGILLALSVTLCLPACAGPEKEAATGLPPSPEQRVEQLRSSISDPKLATDNLDDALEELRGMPEANVPPTFWVKIVDDPAYSAYHRARCLAEYFRRDIIDKAPMSAQQFGRLPGIRNWLRKDTLVYHTGLGPGGARAEDEGWSLLYFVPDFSQHGVPHVLGPKSEWPPPGICLKLSGKVLIDLFVKI